MKVSIRNLALLSCLIYLGTLPAQAQTRVDRDARIQRDADDTVIVRERDGRTEAQDEGAYLTAGANYLYSTEGDNNHGLYPNAKLGYDWTPYIGTEIESGWMLFDYDVDGRDLGNVHAVPILFNLTLKYPVDRFVPYVVGGTGVFLFSFDETNDQNIDDVDFDRAAYGFKAGGGFDYYVSEHWALNVESGYYFMLGADAERTVAGVRIGEDANLDSFYAGAGLKFKF